MKFISLKSKVELTNRSPKIPQFIQKKILHIHSELMNAFQKYHLIMSSTSCMYPFHSPQFSPFTKKQLWICTHNLSRLFSWSLLYELYKSLSDELSLHRNRSDDVVGGYSNRWRFANASNSNESIANMSLTLFFVFIFIRFFYLFFFFNNLMIMLTLFRFTFDSSTVFFQPWDETIKTKLLNFFSILKCQRKRKRQTISTESCNRTEEQITSVFG